MPQKPVEFWATLVGMILFLSTRQAEKEPLQRRLGKIGAAALLALGLAPSLAPWVRDSEIFAAVLIMGLGELILDLAIGIISDREFIKEIIRKKIGGSDGADK